MDASLVLISTLIYIAMKNKVIRDGRFKYLKVSDLGSKYNLTFSSHEIFGSKIIVLDGVKRKLLILEENHEMNQVNLIALEEVSSISVKRIYNSIMPGELRKRKVSEFLKTILLQFDFEDARETFIVPFYENKKDNINDLPDLERKVKKWQLILSKMIGRQNNIPIPDHEKRAHSLVG